MVSPGSQKKLDNGVMAVPSGLDKCGFPFVVNSIQFCFSRHQQLHDVGTALASSAHQRRLFPTGFGSQVNVDTQMKLLFNVFRFARPSSVMQRMPAQLVESF